MFRFLKYFGFGFAKENEVLPIIKQTLNDNLICRLDRNNIFDFKEDDKFYRIKHNYYSKYSTTMIKYNKI